jgi:hypothetical protein
MASLALAALIGATLVVFGAGGSVLTVPVLVYATGLDVHEAAATSLLVVGLAASAGVAARWRIVDVRASVLVGGGGMLGAVAGAWMNHRTPQAIILGTFALTLVVAAWQMLRGGSGAESAAARPHGGGLLVGTGVGVGVATGFFGVGGGFLIVPALRVLLAMPMTRAVATSLLVIALNSGAGLLGHAAHGAVRWQPGFAFSAAALLGALAAAPSAARLGGPSVQRTFAALLIVLGVGMLVQTVRTIV